MVGPHREPHIGNKRKPVISSPEFSRLAENLEEARERFHHIPPRIERIAENPEELRKMLAENERLLRETEGLEKKERNPIKLSELKDDAKEYGAMVNLL